MVDWLKKRLEKIEQSDRAKRRYKGLQKLLDYGTKLYSEEIISHEQFLELLDVIGSFL